jgi:hypothetical protein
MRSPSLAQALLTAVLITLLCSPPSLLAQESSSEKPPLVLRSQTALLLIDPFGGHYEKVTRIGPQQVMVGDSMQIKNFRGEKQGTAPWCWAAAASMMLYHKGIDQNACQIVSRALKRNCCSWQSKFLGDWACWKGGSVQSALSSYGIPSQTLSNLSKNEKIARVLDELVQGRPTTLLMENTRFVNRPNQHPYHVIVAYGAKNLPGTSNKPLEIILYDPLTGVASLPIEQITNYRNDWEKDADTYRWHSLIQLQ